MNFSSEQLDEMKKFFPEVKMAEEGGFSYFFLPNLKMPEGCNPERTDVLLCPTQRDGYPSRLFFAERINYSHKPAINPNPNWNGNTRILDRTWVAISWKINSTLKPYQMVGAHLDGIRG